jgi:uncharacterized membrane protein/plastocyanin
MKAEIFEWLLLLGRWLHITVAITWIGTSIFFMWLDRTLEYNESLKKEGHVGDLWMVHGGGFYHVEKLLMGPTKVPEYLHWFKWESYWTWMSGIFLLTMIFYSGSGTFLLDSAISHITYGEAIALSFSSIVISWFFYDFLWEAKFTRTNPVIGHLLTLIWFGGMSYFLCHTLSGRAAYMHIGGMLGTWMTANVFLRIIPRQVKMVEASKRGEPVNQEWAKNAKNRSTHNTYFTLPVIFIMMSNHFPSTYGHKFNWVILLLMSAAGAAIREFFMVRLKKPGRSKVFGAIGVILIIAAFFLTNTGNSTSSEVVSSLTAGAPVQVVTKTENRHGTIVKGVVKFVGPLPVREKIEVPLICNPSGGDTYANDVLIQDGKVQNALIRVIKGLGDKKFTDVPNTTAVLDQRNCQYEPRVIGVRVGQKVDFVNSDATFHNVRSFTKNNEDFNVAMPMKDQRFTRVFTKPEIFMQTKCSVHPWMSASIAVMDNPYFSVSNAAGEFEIQDLPPGKYTLGIWHEVFGTQIKEITLKENETLNLEFDLKKE